MIEAQAHLRLQSLHSELASTNKELNDMQKLCAKYCHVANARGKERQRQYQDLSKEHPTLLPRAKQQEEIQEHLDNFFPKYQSQKAELTLKQKSLCLRILLLEQQG